MAEKQCKVCGAIKDESEFGSNGQGGKRLQCKPCFSVYSRKYYREHAEKMKEYSRNYRENNRPKLLASERKYNDLHPEKKAAKSIRYYRKHREQSLETNKAWREANKEKVRCRDILNLAIVAGRITRDLSCSKCGSGKKTEAHHDDYTKPLQVVWLCRKCHRIIHQGVLIDG